MPAIEFLQIEPTTRCNFSCGFCAGRHLEQRDLDYEDFTSAVDELGPSLKHVELQGEGEPLLHPRFFEMVEYLRRPERDIKVSVITNGSLLSEEACQRLVSLGIHKVFVSLESADDEVFQRIRGGKPDRVERGIACLMNKKAELGGGPALGLTLTVLKETLEDFPGVRELYARHSLDGGILLQPLQEMTSYTRHYSDEMRAQLLQPNDRRRLQVLLTEDGVMRRMIAQSTRRPSFYQELYLSARQDGVGCPWLARGLYMSAGGVAAACCYVKEDEQGFGPLKGQGASVLAERAQMQASLCHGQLPEPCRGCPLGEGVRRQSGASS